MSKIALTPNSSGTGTFTLAAPDSDTNRTLTLPDSAGELLTATGDGSGLTGVLKPALAGVTSVDAATVAAFEAAGVGGGGLTLLATISTTGAREITTSGLDLSDYSLLYFFGYGVKGNAYYDYAHIRDSGDTTNGRNLIGQVHRTNAAQEGNFGGLIHLVSGHGFCSSSMVTPSNGAFQDSIKGGGLDTGITTSSTSITIGHTEGNSGNFSAGTVKLFGA